MDADLDKYMMRSGNEKVQEAVEQRQKKTFNDEMDAYWSKKEETPKVEETPAPVEEKKVEEEKKE